MSDANEYNETQSPLRIPEPPDLFDEDDQDPHMYPDGYDWAYEDDEADVDDEDG